MANIQALSKQIIEYEQEGQDRAIYGEKTLKALSVKLSETGAKGFSDLNLRLCRLFYLEYPAIWQFLIAKFQNADNQFHKIWQLATAKLIHEPNALNTEEELKQLIREQIQNYEV